MEAKNGSRKKLIVSADDFGLSARTNDKILGLARLGRIDRVAVLVDAFATPEEVSEIQKCGPRTDLHLTLPHGIIKRKGTLIRSLSFFLNYGVKKKGWREVEGHWRRQIEHFRDKFGCIPDGINSHEHVHSFPPFFKIACRLACEFKIGFIRFGKEGVFDSNNPVAKILNYCNKKNKSYFEDSGLESTALIASLDWIKNFDKWSAFEDSVGKKKEIELICHPQREREFEILKTWNRNQE